VVISPSYLNPPLDEKLDVDVIFRLFKQVKGLAGKRRIKNAITICTTFRFQNPEVKKLKKCQYKFI
jgi:hypothetical protein